VENAEATVENSENAVIVLKIDLTEEDIEIFKKNETVETAAMSLSQMVKAVSMFHALV
jgi:hypothetical protein